MNFNIIVLIKQVPDTRNVGKDAMKSDGTVNRTALPAIFNPEDLNALEMALRIKEQIPNTVVTAITMGPVRAADILREALYRGADKAVLVTDKKFAGSDTLATSYILSLAIKKIGRVNLVIGGRQAIDGDTAQVGPQVAEKLNIPQITYAEEVVKVTNDNIQIKRRLERGVELVEVAYPCLITVHSSAPPCRFKNAKKVMKYKKYYTVSEQQNENMNCISILDRVIEEWNASDMNANMEMLGLSGSPTKVKKIDNIVLVQKDNKLLTASEYDIALLMEDLSNNHLLGK
ncbi:MAG: electron transfer flavoprotein subunit beta/FixA family protein [Bacteroidetes bacterium]|nr:electron transfer flavoprotein subunit beta/FixA family protein [Bacteroidota bacterium]MCL1969660.1 electron transfer flavoprotein subunit beta/FixA family protein [Bacteroidota bacterium]